MSEVVLLIGTRKGLWLGRSSDRVQWDVTGPHLGMDEIYSCAIETRSETPRLLVSAASPHWGPSVLRSDDLGQSWQDTPQGAIRFPADTDTALAHVWALQPGPTDQPGVVYAGTEPSALWRSEDSGETFSLYRGLWDHPHREQWWPGAGGQAVHTVLPDPFDAARVTVAMSTGGVYRSTDSGQSWTPANKGIRADFLPGDEPEFGQCVHKVAMHRDRPEQLFAQNHGGVYRSDDRGGSWQSIADGLPGDFGFPIVTHPHRPGTVYVFPLVADADRVPPQARCRVYRSTDAGGSWEALTQGLPQEPFYLPVLRDAMCTDDGDPAGIYFGTRDGAVYGSRDDGDSWAEITRHLPDVLCVRAGTVT